MSDVIRWLVEVRFTCDEGRFVRLFYVVDGISSSDQAYAAVRAGADAECERRAEQCAEAYTRRVQVQAIVHDPLRGVVHSTPSAVVVHTSASPADRTDAVRTP
ncbi:hypothetical protein AB0F77_38050 [Streptomyces sp. NPDC026672]|uniref:hypothetical protein n=1 Tax=unclassified Streptomyces TaxID=2593676 RepID=UPI0033CE2A6E